MRGCGVASRRYGFGVGNSWRWGFLWCASLRHGHEADLEKLLICNGSCCGPFGQHQGRRTTSSKSLTIHGVRGNFPQRSEHGATVVEPGAHVGVLADDHDH